MNTKFTASNGIEIEITEDGYLRGNKHIHPGVLYATAGPDGVEALREYFQHERDQELNRWRDPKDPNFVIYNSDIEYVRVVNEATGTSDKAWRDDPRALSTAKRYFEAHPESKPWDEAEPGEVWELTDAEGREQLWVWDEIDGWRSVHSNKVSHLVGREATAGRRIWPEEG